MTAPDPGTEMARGDVAGAIALELHGARVPRQVSDQPTQSNGAGAAQPAEAPVEAAAAWEAVYRDHVMAVHRFAAARTGNRPDAEDVTAQVFLRALPRLRRDAAAGEVRSYLLATARTVLAEHWTSRFGAPLEPLDEERDKVSATAPGPVDDASSPDRGAARVAAILSRLPENYRRVLELRFLRGCSVRETAEQLGISIANAKVLQFRALRRAQQLEGDAA
jgi:RNA polymerase sigma-70 factor (ECF subfamily)